MQKSFKRNITKRNGFQISKKLFVNSQGNSFQLIVFFSELSSQFDKSSGFQDGKESSKSKSIVKTFKKELGVAPHGSIAAYSESILNKAISAAESLNKRERDCLDVHYATLVAT